MQIYSVGGFVRDTLLRAQGYVVPENGDRDWVVVGSTPEEMIQKGFTPVGADFPVFLHPVTHEEYALARTERKTAPGYHGFIFHTSPNVRLEDDLKRRDLTINAIAQSESGQLFDPFNGQQDLKLKVLRHVSDAFAEDPVRILRVARFSAKFPDFQIAPETMELMQNMVRSGETDALVPERVWAEISRGLMLKAPLRMIDALSQCGLWSKLIPINPTDPLFRETLNRAVSEDLPLDARFALLTSFCDSAIEAKNIAVKLKTPSAIQQLSESFHRLQAFFSLSYSAEVLNNLYEKGDALRRPHRMLLMLRMWAVKSQKPVNLPEQGLALWQSVDAGQIAHQQSNPKLIPLAIRQARMDALTPLFHSQ